MFLLNFFYYVYLVTSYSGVSFHALFEQILLHWFVLKDKDVLSRWYKASLKMHSLINIGQNLP